MRLSEIVDWDTLPLKKADFPKSVERKVLDRFMKRMNDKGFTKLGDGGFGIVFEKPGLNYVVKLYLAKDRAYTAFLEFCAANQDNPHLPRVAGESRIMNDQFHVCLLEKLAEIEDSSPVTMMIRSVSDAIDEADTFADFVSMVAKYQDARHNNPSGIRYTFYETTPDILKTLFDLKAVKEAGGFHWDWKSTNMMMRGDTLVMTDPLKI